jgi:hypothetical protein
MTRETIDEANRRAEREVAEKAELVKRSQELAQSGKDGDGLDKPFKKLADSVKDGVDSKLERDSKRFNHAEFEVKLASKTIVCENSGEQIKCSRARPTRAVYCYLCEKNGDKL